METIKEIKNRIENADMVLIGIGSQLSLSKEKKEDILQVYQNVYELVKDKPWFVVTLNTDDLIYESNFHSMLVVAPCGSDASGNVVTNEDYDESQYLPQWQFYMNWLTSTLGKKLCILELGVGMEYPSVVRMPFERTIQLNQKSSLIRIHSSLAFVPEEIASRSLCIMKKPSEIFVKIDKNN